jgi:hypothetical protein
MQYSELKTAIQDYMETSETEFVAHIDDFIKASEDTIFAAIEGPLYWKASETTTMVSGQFSYTLPDGVMDVLSIRLCEDIPGNMTTGGPFRYLDRRDLDYIFEAYPGTTGAVTTGIPKCYAVESTGVNAAEVNMNIRVGPVPGAAYKTSVEYYGKATTDSITDGGDTKKTWLSVSYPTLLLYGSLIDACLFQRSDQSVQAEVKGVFDQGMSLLKNFTEGRQATDTFAANDEGINR